MAFGDFNQDYRADIAVCQRGLNSVGIYLQTSNGNFPNAAAGTYAAGISPAGLVAVPLGRSSGRAAMDLVAASGPSAAYTLLTNNNDGSGTFTPVVNPNNLFDVSATSTNTQLVTRDFENNGWADFIYLLNEPSFPVVSGVYWQRLTSATSVERSTATSFRPGYRPSSFALDDFDRDGLPDVVVTSSQGNEFSVVLSASNGTSTPNWRTSGYVVRLPSSGSQPVDVATGDVNRDLLPDVAIAHGGSADITLFLNLRNNQYGAQALYPLSAAPRKVLLQDLNNDGSPEMLVLTADNRLQVFQHTGASGAARYGSPIVLATGADPVTMNITDIDGDYAPDIVVGCVGDNTVRVYLNRSMPLATRTATLAGVEAYPNPASTQITVQRAPSLQGPLTATLFDGLGRRVHSATIAAPAGTLSVADLPRGVYLLQLSAATGVTSQRVIVQ